MKANIVYKFQCHGCNNQYIGETNRHLKTRISEHTQMSRSSKILDHIGWCKDRIKSNNIIHEFSIMCSNFDSYYERVICESLLIKFHKPKINIQNGNSKTTSLLRIFH